MEYKKIKGPKDWSHRLVYRFPKVIESEDECPHYSSVETLRSIAIYLEVKAQGKWKIEKSQVYLAEKADAFAIRLYFYDFLVEIHEISSNS